MFLLDTNTISELRKVAIGKGDSSVAAWAAAQDFRACYTSAVVMMELERGVLAMERKDAPQGQRLRNWLKMSLKNALETTPSSSKLALPKSAPNCTSPTAAPKTMRGLPRKPFSMV